MRFKGIIIALCLSTEKGVAKKNETDAAVLIKNTVSKGMHMRKSNIVR